MSSNEVKIAGIRNTVNNGVKVASDNIFDATGEIDVFEVQSPNLPVFNQSYEKYVCWRRRIREVSREYNHIVLPSYVHMTTVSPRRCRANVVPFVYHLHEISARPSSLIGRFNIRMATRNLEECEKAVTCSEITKQHILEHTDLTADQLSLIGLGVDTETFYPERAPPTGFELPDKYILYVGSFLDRKNPGFLVDVMESLPEDYNLVTAGYSINDKNRGNFVEYAKRKNVFSRIRMLGYLDDIKDLRKLYSSAEVYLHPAKFEGWGLSPAEAAACGTPPVLYADIPVARELKSVGELFKDFDARTVAKKVNKVAGRDMDYEPTTWEECAESLIDEITSS